MLSDETAGLDEVARAIGKTPDWLKRNWLKFHRAENFPRKIPGGFVWPRRAVEVWLRSGGALLPEPANQNGAGDFIADAAQALKQRYGAQP